MFLNKNKQVRSGWLIFIALVIVFIGNGIFMLPGMTLLTILEISAGEIAIEIEGDLSTMSPVMILLTQGAGTFGGIAATLVVFRAINKKNPNKLGVQGPGKDLAFGLLLGAASITVIFFILLLTGDVTLLSSIWKPTFSWYTLAFLILFILVGFFEEMFFRGYVMKTMAERGNKKWVIYIVSALVFGLVHTMNPNVSFFGIVNVALVGLLFAYMFDITKSLLLPIGYHITWNFFQGNVFGFAVSGISPHGLYAINISDKNELLTGGSFGLEGSILATLLIILGFVATNFYAKSRQAANIS